MQDKFEITYETPSQGALKVLSDGETVWLTQAQMRVLFGRERSVVTKHIIVLVRVHVGRVRGRAFDAARASLDDAVCEQPSEARQPKAAR